MQNKYDSVIKILKKEFLLTKILFDVDVILIILNFVIIKNEIKRNKEKIKICFVFLSEILIVSCMIFLSILLAF